MGDLSKNLSRHEMACTCGCGFDTIDAELLEVMQSLCDHYLYDTGFKVSLIVSGPNRCRDKNDDTPGSSPNSQHQYARAMDFMLFARGNQIPPEDIYKHLCAKYPDKYGFGLYSNRVHLDTRTNGPARWKV